MIRLAKVSRVHDLPPLVEGFVHINCVSWFPNNVQRVGNVVVPSYEVSPYHLKDAEGCLMECIWQSAKIFKTITAQHVVYNNRVTWSHPSEVHVDDAGNVLPAYWAWRYKLLHNPYPVRYPNGYAGKKDCLCVLWQNENGIYEKLSYIEARRKLYCPKYAELVMKTNAFSRLKELHDAGVNLQLTDVDVPIEGVTLTKELYQRYLQDPSISFGHAWTLGACLLGEKWWQLE